MPCPNTKSSIVLKKAYNNNSTFVAKVTNEIEENINTLKNY
ncbi:44644_t:CDS:1, partial [Gigaspora margarita]